MALVLLRELDDRFMADLWTGALESSGVPYLLRTFEDTAYDGLFITQKGFGRIMVEEEWLETARAIDADLSSQLAAGPSGSAELAAHLDHTLLDAKAGFEELEQFLGQCRQMACAAACVLPWMVPRAAAALAGGLTAVCSVVSFPLGADTGASKARAAAELAEAGAGEIDVVVNYGWVLAGRVDQAAREMGRVVQACQPAVVKAILETPLLGPELSAELAEALLDSGVGFLKTGTGFAGPATVDDVELLATLAAGRLQVKAAGGITTLAQAQELIEAGAGRLGASAGYGIWRQAGGGA